ncbi:DNA repair protein RecO [Clostridium argentinense CDC 2741]|uniref:DNA repair protein RecO n=1 Tax=Clostridium argentinense CDC 2741 TaxID=1418104 RepID=A0A0C1R107_9CLOT|nr:DNA repair protein RecO [Clostridium argentinense]HAG44308.1 DNA repair protein RecO [Clostridium sp.]ARC85521.1 DNA repair protein RecO [Clostridium argentinense]KIE47062.1 DNA repair protein RecO [Clostridium argentinense CDC 2741]NFF40034.1 DNA repair protein RecO [Clostridium argentinense]NFP50266.1 DNA repair protein RecO [Clostridium argentinense]
MSIIKTRAVVIKTQDYKENDKLVWLFSEELGKISVIAKGARKSKSKLMSSTLPFCYGEYVVFKGRNLYTLNEAKIIDSFQQMLTDFEILIYGSYFNELIDIACEEENYGTLFKDFVTSFYLIKNSVADLEILARAFELKLLRATGYGLNLEQCSICDKKLKSSNYLSFQYYGMVCNECEKAYGIHITALAYNILKFLNSIELEKVPRVTINEEAKKELNKILSSIINANYTRKPKSLLMLKHFDYIEEKIQK